MISLPSDLPGTIRTCLEDLLAPAEKAGVTIRLEATPTLCYNGNADMQVSGYFQDRPTAILAVATGKPLLDWVQIALHEGCHMHQWLEGAACWKALRASDTRDIIDDFDEWLAGTRELDASTLKEYTQRIQAVEYDCERRVLELIQRYNLPLDAATYAQKANAYVWFYHYVARARRWSPGGQAPYQNEAMARLFPTTLTPCPEVLPAAIEAAFVEAYGSVEAPLVREAA